MANVHKSVTVWYLSLRAIVFAINIPSYKLAKFLVPLLTSLISNDFTIKDLFSFTEEVSSFDCANYMTSFDIESLFTNIPLAENINICTDKRFENNTRVNNLTKESFRSLLELPTLDSFFTFHSKYCKQKDGLAMGSPLGPTLANVFLCHFEEQWISDWPIDYKSFSYRRYVGDTFLLFSFELYVTKCLTYMSSKHGNIKFTVERKEKNLLSFLDKNIFRHSGKFQTSIYRKSIFSSRLTNFESFLPIS